MSATVPYHLSTPNRGRIVAAERAELRGKHNVEGGRDGLPVGGLHGSNTFDEPDGWITGPHGGSVGGTDPLNDGWSDC